MAVEVQSAFPSYIVAGNTVRITLADGDYPSDDWTLDVVFRGPSSQTFRAEAGDNDDYELVLTASKTAKLLPGNYSVTFLYTHTDGERDSGDFGRIEVLANPSQTGPASLARQTLEAMQQALHKIAQGTLSNASFNGQSFTKKNLKELQDAIDRQQAIVSREENGSNLASGRNRYAGIGIRFAPSGGGCW